MGEEGVPGSGGVPCAVGRRRGEEGRVEAEGEGAIPAQAGGDGLVQGQPGGRGGGGLAGIAALATEGGGVVGCVHGSQGFGWFSG